jgi:hypothetical protein
LTVHEMAVVISPWHQLQTDIRPRPVGRDYQPAIAVSNRNDFLKIAVDRCA